MSPRSFSRPDAILLVSRSALLRIGTRSPSISMVRLRRKGFCELHAINPGQDVDANRFDSDLDDLILRQEILRKGGGDRSTESLQGRDDPGWVLHRGGDPDVEADGCPDMAMGREGVSPYDQEFSACVA